jgi:RNA polymerase sigma-70 factor (ECF subfamily)
MVSFMPGYAAGTPILSPGLLKTRRGRDYIDVGDPATAVPATQQELYEAAVREFGRMLDRLATGYEADPEKRLDLRQEIHLQLWRSFAAFDGRCSLKTWALRVAHNTATSYVDRERRKRAALVSLEEVEQSLPAFEQPPDIDRRRAIERIQQLVQTLKPLDRQIMLSYLEGMTGTEIAEVTGLSAPNVGMKIHRIKNILVRRCFGAQTHAG